jgi:hypothetical protein
MREPDLQTIVYLAGTKTRFSDGECSPWRRYVIIYTTISNDLLGKLYDAEDHVTC